MSAKTIASTVSITSSIYSLCMAVVFFPNSFQHLVTAVSSLFLFAYVTEILKSKSPRDTCSLSQSIVSAIVCCVFIGVLDVVVMFAIFVSGVDSDNRLLLCFTAVSLTLNISTSITAECYRRSVRNAVNLEHIQFQDNDDAEEELPDTQKVMSEE
eukprot:TRINITY_DN178_c0_g5_i1.p1 TRINITY_DN178_c0_g5~~TRINITY_DN178_c0_g5_i1.p1  ORF type:complete len:155 (+),score=22.97 TRINITY_DN178_c0_g5_i1:42-506(+)